MPEGGQVWAEAFSRVLMPRDRLTVSEWADQFRVLSGKAASEPGQWRTDRAPYMREPMDCLSADSDVEEVVIWAGTQLGKSEACNNWIAYAIDRNPGPMMLVQPTLDLAKKFSKQRLASMIAASPVLREKVQPARSKDSGNTIFEKEYDGGILLITGANSATGLRSMPVRDLLFDEIDGYPFDVDGEGSPIELAEKRQDTFARRKRLKTSTCTIKGESQIEASYAASDRRKFYVPCPHCGHFQVLRWAQLKWYDDPKTPRYLCEDCGTHIEETAKGEMLSRGEWRAEVPDSPIRGYWINSLYSPLGWISWRAIVKEFLAAKVKLDTGDSAAMQVFVNTRLAETWELSGHRLNEHEIQKRAEPYALRSIPAGVLLVTASVDVQGDRLEVSVHGWGRGEEYWAIDYAKLYGDPALTVVWDQLDEFLLRPLQNAFGVEMRIAATAIDHGGHHSTQVEKFCRARTGRHVIAIKGQSQSGKPVIGRPAERDTNWRGKKITRGVKIWPVGSDTAKHVLAQRLALDKPGPGYVHTSAELPDEYYRGLTAEQLMTRYVAGRPKSEWVLRKGVRNEPLDLWVYGYAAAAYCGMLRWKDLDWDQRAAMYEPAPKQEPAPPAASPKPWRRVGTIGGKRRF